LTPTTAITAALLSADAVGYDAPALRMKYTKAQAQHLENAFISSGKTRTPSARVRQEAADATGLRFETAIQVLHGNAYTLN
jgi:hypothetical protein